MNAAPTDATAAAERGDSRRPRQPAAKGGKPTAAGRQERLAMFQRTSGSQRDQLGRLGSDAVSGREAS